MQATVWGTHFIIVQLPRAMSSWCGGALRNNRKQAIFTQLIEVGNITRNGTEHIPRVRFRSAG